MIILNTDDMTQLRALLQVADKEVVIATVHNLATYKQDDFKEWVILAQDKYAYHFLLIRKR